MTYRDVEFILRDDEVRIDKAATAFIEALDFEEDNFDTYIEQAKCFATAMILYQERNDEVHDAWRAVGFLGNLLTLYGKVVRLMKSLWWHRAAGNSEKPLDNAVDALNYAAFFMRGYMDHDERGERR